MKSIRESYERWLRLADPTLQKELRGMDEAGMEDAFYRELRRQMEERRAEGCLTVDMELAGVQAVCAFHGWELYSFLQCGDVLDLPEWDVAGLREANHCLDNFALALKIAESL